MNTQEFAEWLRREIATWEERFLLLLDEDDIPSAKYAQGRASASKDALSRLTSLDSSHDLPSTKGR